MEYTITLNTADRSVSTVVVGGGLVARLDDYLPAGRVIIVTDANVYHHYKSLIDNYEHIVVEGGESCKTLATAEKLYRELIGMHADRQSVLVGFGGGVVSDIAGFVASTYMRGVRFGFVASTLLAQVDASVGGKNGVNVDGYKNMVGTFRQPEFVLCDTDLLRTLPEREFRAGLAEVIKVAAIADATLFEVLEERTFSELVSDQQLLNNVIAHAVGIKADIVQRDERESGVRRKLNFGHTFAHAIERESGSYNHGEAVATGMAMAGELAVRVWAITTEDRNRIVALLDKFGLPTRADIGTDKLIRDIRIDKKSDNGMIRIVLPTEIGSCEVRQMGFDELEEIMK